MNKRNKEQIIPHYNVLKHCNGILIFIIILIFFIPQKVWGNNLLVNPGFESESQPWKTNYSSISFSIDHENFYEGSSSAKVSNSKSSSYGIEQVITDISSTLNYKISSYIKLISPYPEKTFIRIAWYKSTDGSGSQLSTSDSPFASLSSDWQKVEYIVAPPETVMSAKIRLLVATGSAYFDSIFFEEYFPPTPIVSPITTLPPATQTLAPTNQPVNQLTPTPALASYDNIYLSEVYPYPQTGENEWLELYNDNDFSVELNNWYFDDVENGGSSPKTISLTIEAKSYAVFDLTLSMFNNTGDNVRLLDFNKNLKDSFEYSEGEKSKSWGRTDFQSDQYCLQEPTKNSVNGSCLNQTVAVSPTSKSTSTLLPTSKTTETKNKVIASYKPPNSIPLLSLTKKQSKPINQSATVLGINTEAPTVNTNKPLLTSLTLVSFSNSLLTIFSVLLKIKIHEGI